MGKMLWLFQHTCTPPGTMDARWSLFSIISQTFGLGQTNWVDILGGSWSIFGQTIKTILVLWVPRPWENGFSCFIFKKLWFSGLKHMCLKYIPNMIFAVKKLGNRHHTSIVGGPNDQETYCKEYKMAYVRNCVYCMPILTFYRLESYFPQF